MFIQATNRYNRTVLINVQAIAYVELDIQVKDHATERGLIQNGLVVYLLGAEGEESSRRLIRQEFIGEEAQKLREQLPQILNAHVF